MSYSPALIIQAPPINICTMSPESCGVMSKVVVGTTPTSQAIGTANLAIYVPFSLRQGVTVTQLWAFNGSTAAGNTDLAVYGDDYAARINITAALQVGTSNAQAFDCTDTYLPPGNYYWGVIASDATSTFFSYQSLPLAKVAGVYSQAVGAANLPDPMVPATMTALGMVPIIGMLCSPQSAI